MSINWQLRDIACVVALVFLVAAAHPVTAPPDGAAPRSAGRAMLTPALRAPQLGLMLMAHLRQRPSLQSKGLSHLLLFNGAAIYNSMRSPLPPTEAPAGVDPKHGSDWARHIPVFMMPF